MLQKDQVAEQRERVLLSPPHPTPPHPTPPHDMLQKAVSAKSQTQEVK